MPLSDIADQSFDYFKSNVDYSLKTKELFSWENKIPDSIFLHFVLPIRVNNENLDKARAVFSKLFIPGCRDFPYTRLYWE